MEQRARISTSKLLILMLALLMSAASVAKADPRGGGGGKDRWKALRPAPLECGSEFHDPQSKWLQSELVVQARWRQLDEHKADALGAFNITVNVKSMLKPWRVDLKELRITVGQFNRSLGRQKGLQKELCAPNGPARRFPYIFFLTPTADPNYFKHRFLPVKFNKNSKNKLTRIQCREVKACRECPFPIFLDLRQEILSKISN